MSRLLIVVAVAVLALSSVEGLTTKVEPRSRACFTEEVQPEVPLSFQFQVTAGGKLDVNCDVYDSSGRKLHSWTQATEGHYNAHGDRANNKFKFCFGNEMAAFTPKWVNFHLIKGHHPSAAKKDQLDPIEKQIEELTKEIDGLAALQMQLRQTEHDHRNTIEDANERVLLWSVFEVIALFVMGLFQVFFVKRFLEVRATV